MYNISRYNNFRDFERDDIIYADEFKNLMTEINNLYINKRACHTCNTTCNSTCNNCNECNICESNDTCIFGQCRGCDTCQGCDSACNQCISCQNCNTTQYY